MALKVTTTIRNMGDVSAEDFAEAGDYKILCKAQESSSEVLVDCCATDGYYDITTQFGQEVSAVSWFHLEGFNKNGIILFSEVAK